MIHSITKQCPICDADFTINVVTRSTYPESGAIGVEIELDEDDVAALAEHMSAHTN